MGTPNSKPGNSPPPSSPSSNVPPLRVPTRPGIIQLAAHHAVNVPVGEEEDATGPTIGPPLPVGSPVTSLLYGEIHVQAHPVVWRDGSKEEAAVTVALHTERDDIDGGGTTVPKPTPADFYLPVVAPLTDVEASNRNHGGCMLLFTLASSEKVPIGHCLVPVGSLRPGAPIDGTFEVDYRHEPPRAGAEDPEQGTEKNIVGDMRVTVTLSMYDCCVTADTPTNDDAALRRNLRVVADPRHGSVCSSNPGSTLAPPSSGSEAHSPRSAAKLPARQFIDGIKNAAKSVAAVPETLSVNDYSRDASKRFSLPGSETVEMKDYAPKVFAKMRAMSGISVEHYASEWDLPDSKLNLNFGAGRSGSLFLHSKNKCFILKTIPHDEVCTFFDILQSYHEHVTTHRESIIMRVYGLHRFSWGFTSQYIIIFGNILWCTRMDVPVEIFDLKGREIKKGKAFKRREETGLVWKDKDMERFVWLANPDREQFFKQLDHDVMFLQHHNMMDYSFLCGVRRLPPDWDPNAADMPTLEGGSQFRNSMGGTYSAQRGGEVYYMGLIDCLTNYSNKKRVANLCKKVLWEQQQLSTVPSQQYATRFMKWIKALFPSEEESDDSGLLSRHPNHAMGPKPLLLSQHHARLQAGQVVHYNSSPTTTTTTTTSSSSGTPPPTSPVKTNEAN
eukprot:TRINITY_DN67530_c4_g6_i1.p1 TRINITY_DN67530_c4_g6~~TRINITY_DN67530_c4_g6_i1.p1  ORF type:complete len:670 (+),score=62.77 TRINITY_DN67530_c4_g6_i1:87-2096(+)